MIYAIDLSTNFAPAKFTNIATLLNIILPLLTLGAVVIFLFVIIKASFNILTHGDEPKVIEKSKITFGIAIIGLIIVIVSFLAVNLIGRLLGINNLLPQ
jgi:heme/copper-type cytochrome/quinol oxidase subunit 2